MTPQLEHPQTNPTIPVNISSNSKQAKRIRGTPQKATLEKIAKVARARVEGMTWAQVAERFGYSGEDSACVTCTQQHPELWRETYERERVKYLDGIEIDAIMTQRELMQQTDIPQLRQSAAHSLLNHCAKLRAQKVELSGSVTSRVERVILDMAEVDSGGEQVALPADSQLALPETTTGSVPGAEIVDTPHKICPPSVG